MLNEADTRAKLIDPKLKACGWTEQKIRRDIHIIPGLIVDERGKRQKGKKPDYILYANSSLPIAIVEAKEEGKSALDGMQQAKDYAQALGCLFAYASNGHAIELFDFTSNEQRTVQDFFNPEELYKRYLKHTLKSEERPAPVEHAYHIVPGGKKPRYYQEHAINNIVAAILCSRKRILLAMATGTGKTYVVLCKD